MELRQLRYFIAVADSLNFSRAAESLYISQSSLSQQIADLERELGVDLMKRSKRSVELTASGKTMLRISRDLLNRADKLAQEVRQTASTEMIDRTIYLGLDISIDHSFCIPLTAAINKTKSSVPGLRPTFEMFEHEQLTRSLDFGAIDLGFYLYHDKAVANRNQLNSQVLLNDEMVLAFRADTLPDNNPDSIKYVLNSRGLILLERETRGMSQVLRILDSIGVEPSIRFCETRDIMVLTAQCGEGAAILPLSVVKDINDPSIKYLHFQTSLATLYLIAVWKSSNNNSLIQLIIHNLAENIQSLQTV